MHLDTPLNPLRPLALSRRPALAAVGVFIGGIIVHANVAHHPVAWIACAILSAGIGIAWFRRDTASSMAVAGAIFFVGIATTQLAAFYFSHNDINAFSSDTPRLAKLELDIDQPLRTIGTGLDRRPISPRQVTTATVRRVLTHAGWIDASGKILVQIDPPNQHLALGQRIRVFGMLQRPAPAMNPGQFDWSAYYREQRVLTSIQVPHSDAITIVSTSTPTLLARARQWVRARLADGFTKEQSLDHALLRALVLGDNDPELRDIQEQFRRTGTSHHLAISGMHIAVVGFAIYWIARLLRIRPGKTVGIAMAIVLVYGLLALPSPPVVRSVTLCLCLGIGVLLRRTIDPLQLLSLTALFMLVYHPLDLFSAGFQLSFGTVLGLMLFADRTFEAMGGTPSEDERVARGLMVRPQRSRLRSWLRRTSIAVFSAGLVAWAVSMPLIAYHFEQINPWAVLASLLLAPFVFAALLGGFGKIILTILLPFGASWWASIAGSLVGAMRWFVDVLAQIPGSDVPLPAKSISFIVVYYALICLPFLPISWPRVKRSLRLSPVAAVLLLALLPLTGGATGLPDGALRITMLAVGAGQCCVMELPDGRVILIDAGAAAMNEPVRRCIGPFLRSRGRSHVDEIWLTDGDFDHLGAAGEIVTSYGVPKVVMGSAFELNARHSAAGETLLTTLAQRKVQIDRLSRGARAELGRGVVIEALWPPTGDTSLLANESDLVLKLTYARRTILFPADIQRVAQSRLLRDRADLRCDVLIAPHHGSGESTTADFVSAADPLYIVSSNDRTLSQKQRLFEQQVGDRPLFRTNECGAVSITIDRNGGVIVTPHLRTEPAEAIR